MATCGDGAPYDGRLNVRIASIFVILVTSLAGTLFPIFARRAKSFNIHPLVFDTVKYFGSGVIIATAFIHLLAPAQEELGNECLGGTWEKYPWVSALAMGSIFALFIVEFFAFRAGTAYLDRHGITLDAHDPSIEHHTAHEHRPHQHDESPTDTSDKHQTPSSDDHSHNHDDEAAVGLPKKSADSSMASSPIAKILGVLILEVGVIFHSFVIGLTLAVSNEFSVLFPVLIFHQTFEGLGLGSRLAELELPSTYHYFPYYGAVAYSIFTPLGIATGLGIRSSFDPEGRGILIVSGILDSVSAGILLYTGLVELLAHEFIFHPHFKRAPLSECLYALGLVLLGAGIMALLGYWA